MTESQLKQLTQQLAAIELPPEPNWWPLLWSILGIGIILLVIAVIIRKKNRNKYRNGNTLLKTAPQRLTQIQQQWRNGKLDQRNTAYQLATLLRLALGLKQLNHNTPDSLADQHAQWQTTITLLQQLRYQTHSDAQLNEQTFVTIQQWLKQSTATC